MRLQVNAQTNQEGKQRRGPLSAGNVILTIRAAYFCVIWHPVTQFWLTLGLDISVIPPTDSDKLSASTNFLYAANGSFTNLNVQKEISFDLGLRRDFGWLFTTADVPHTIIRADILGHYDLLIDLQGKRIMDKVTSLRVRAQTNYKYI